MLRGERNKKKKSNKAHKHIHTQADSRCPVATASQPRNKLSRTHVRTDTPTRVVSGRRDVKMDEREGPQTAICT